MNDLDHAVGEFAAGDGPRLIALDFDGTLAPFVADPMRARPLPAAHAALVRIASLPERSRVALALVSGRRLGDLARCAGAPVGTLVVGSHGAETGRIGPDGLDTVPLELTRIERAQLGDLLTRLREVAIAFPGAWVEAKPTAAVLHTRRVVDEAEAHQASAQALTAASSLGLRALAGNHVVEVAVRSANKGDALNRLRSIVAARWPGASPVRVLFAGDDTTDEHALRILGPHDVGIKVGSGDTAARWRVADPEAFAQFLGRLADVLDA